MLIDIGRNMHIEILSPADCENEISAFLNNVAEENHSVLGYHYPFYLGMLSRIDVGTSLALVARSSDGQIRGYLPVMVKETDLGKVMCSLPFFGPNAGVISHREEEVEQGLINALLEWADKDNVISCTVYSPFDDDRALQRYSEWMPHALKVDKFTNYLLLNDLKLDNSLLYDLRKAERSGVSVQMAHDASLAQEVYAIYMRNCIDYGIPPKPYNCIEQLMAQSGQHQGTATYFAMHEGRMIGALIMIYSPCTASYYLPCSIHEFRSFQPTTLLIHHAMRESVAVGRRIWNWESSPSAESGVYKFKKKWGSMDGRYAIFVNARREADFFRSTGTARIAENYPFFFVYPFNRL